MPQENSSDQICGLRLDYLTFALSISDSRCSKNHWVHWPPVHKWSSFVLAFKAACPTRPGRLWHPKVGPKEFLWEKIKEKTVHAFEIAK